MGLDATGRRRVVGASFLAAALAMLVAGQTVLQSRLRDLSFLIYWLACFLFTGGAIFVAFLDARALAQRTRREARDLLETTFNRIQADAKEKPPRSDLRENE